MWILNREDMIKKIKDTSKSNLKEERYIIDVYYKFLDTYFSIHELEELAEGRKKVCTKGRTYSYKKLEELSDKDLYEILITLKQDEVTIMKFKFDNLED